MHIVIKHCIDRRATRWSPCRTVWNANLRELIAATGLVTSIKLDYNCWFCSPCDLEIWWMTSKSNRAPLLYYIKLCKSFQIHRWIQPWVTVRKRSFWSKIGDVLSCVHHFKAKVNSNWSYSPETLNSGQNRRFFVPYELEFWRMTLKTIGHLFFTTSSFVHHVKAIGEFKLELQSGNAQLALKSAILCHAWPGNLMDDLEKQ